MNRRSNSSRASASRVADATDAPVTDVREERGPHLAMRRGGHGQRGHDVLQLTHIPRPRIPGQGRHGAMRQRGARADARRERPPEMMREHRDVFRPLAQRRHTHSNHVEPIQQVLPEAAGLRLRAQIAIDGADDPDVHLPAERLPDPSNLLLLQHAQQLRLGARREVHHLVEEQRAAVGFLDETRALGDRAREGASGVAKELRLEEFVRKRRAVEIAEPALATRAQAVNGTRHELLSDSALALDQDGKRRTPRLVSPHAEPRRSPG